MKKMFLSLKRPLEKLSMHISWGSRFSLFTPARAGDDFLNVRVAKFNEPQCSQPSRGSDALTFRFSVNDRPCVCILCPCVSV